MSYQMYFVIFKLDCGNITINTLMKLEHETT